MEDVYDACPAAATPGGVGIFPELAHVQLRAGASVQCQGDQQGEA